MRAILRQARKLLRRTLLSRRLALALLILMTLTVIVGSLLPQAGRFGPLEYEQWRAEHPALATWMEASGLNQVFSSLWFWGLATLMALNLLCLNGQRAYRLARGQQPRPGVDRAGRSHGAAFGASTPPSQVAEAVARTVARHGYHVEVGRRRGEATCLEGVRGTAGHWGSIVFHLSLLVVLAGGALQALAGASGWMLLTEGQTVRDVAEDYLVAPRPASASSFSGLDLTLDKVVVNYAQGRRLTDLAAQFSVLRNGLASQEWSRVNEPLSRGGKQFVFNRYGFAPLFVLRDAGGVERFHTYVNLMVRQNGEQDAFRIPGTALDVAVRLYPEAVEAETDTGLDSATMWPRRPMVYLVVLDDDLEVYRGPVALNDAAPLPNGSLAFAGLRYWALFRVVQNTGEVVLFTGFWLGLIGLVLRFGLVERRVVVRVTARGTGSLVSVSGAAEQFNVLYTEEFVGLVAAMAKEVEGGAQRNAVLLGRRRTVYSE